ncbi:hypothetical protein, partial [Agrobacterium tumefaciens]|uniref:hypothetical protein n=1 Tax=Agrobacterium tumefaciens TaxID=358 RepID=UPI001B8A08DF
VCSTLDFDDFMRVLSPAARITARELRSIRPPTPSHRPQCGQDGGICLTSRRPAKRTGASVISFRNCYNGGPLKKPCKSAPNFRTDFHQT